uniref:Probable pectate lyase F n=1 Tax=Ditylenchus dipsaci TaxID=166011 RepID=A0A915D270_9BILA
MFCYISLLVILGFFYFFQTGQSQFWPAATRNITVNATITVNASTTFNCNYTRYIPNPTLLGNGADGVHCRQAGCNITNVWFEDVGEDAMSFFGNTSDNLAITVRGTVFIYDFWVHTFTRFARTCGNCAQQYARHFVISNLTATNGTAGQYVAGINFNYNDSATITGLKLGDASARNVPACKRFRGVPVATLPPMELMRMVDFASTTRLTLLICLELENKA